MKCDNFVIIATKGKRKIYIQADKDDNSYEYQDYIDKRIFKLKQKGYDISAAHFCGGQIKAEIKIYEEPSSLGDYGYPSLEINYICTACKNTYFRNLPRMIDDLEKILQEHVDKIYGVVEYNHQKFMKELEERNYE